MDAIFLNSKNNIQIKFIWSDLSEKINFKRSDKYVALSNISI